MNRLKRMAKWLKIKRCEIKKTITAARYFGWFSTIIQVRIRLLVIYGLVYPIIRVLSKKQANIVCHYLEKAPTGNKPFSFLPIIKSGIIIERASDWGSVIEIYINDTYRMSALKAGMIILDVGAHIGGYSLLASERGAKTVVSIEPEVSNYRQLLKNIAVNGAQNITPLNIALSDSQGKEKLYLDSSSGRHSLVNKNTRFEPVTVKTIDIVLKELGIPKIDLIKIDAEGAEMAILRGAEKTLCYNPNVKLLVASEHYPDEPQEVQNFLTSLGFKTTVSNFDIVETL